MKAIAPGKLILSGEHAVVYGRPSIAMAIDRSAEAVITPGAAGEDVVSFDLADLKQKESYTLRALRAFSERIRKRLRLDFARANTLGVAYGRLTGTLLQRPWGDIVDGAEKKRVLLEVCELMGISTEQAIAVGDGANDLPMMEASGLSVAYHAKPRVREQALVSIEEGGLDRLLELFVE